MSLAKAVISGVVKRDPQITTTQNNMDLKIASFPIAIEEDDTLRVVAFGNLADNVGRSLKAGNKVVVEGQLRNYVGKDSHGQDLKTLELRLASFEVISGSAGTVSGAPAVNSTTQTSEVVKFSDTEEIAGDFFGDEEIPF